MTTLIVVEDQPTADSMQKGVDPQVVLFTPAMRTRLEGRFTNIFVKWPSPHWFEARRVTQDEFQDWVRMDLTHHQSRGGDFMYF